MQHAQEIVADQEIAVIATARVGLPTAVQWPLPLIEPSRASCLLSPMAGCRVESNRRDHLLVLPIPNIPSHCAHRLHGVSPLPAS